MDITNANTFEELKIYESDINLMELIQFRACIKEENIKSPESMYSFIQENNIVATFANLNIILRIYLTLPISNARGERKIVFGTCQGKTLFEKHVRTGQIKCVCCNVH